MNKLWIKGNINNAKTHRQGKDRADPICSLSFQYYVKMMAI